MWVKGKRKQWVKRAVFSPLYKNVMQFIQTDNVQDHIIPLIKSKKNIQQNGFIYHELIGTGFFIGSKGYAITASHVIDQLLENHSGETDAINVLLQKYPAWFAFEIDQYEKHPTEDVGIIKIKSDQQWRSNLVLLRDPQYACCEYNCWGYPHEIAKELQLLEHNAPERPELIYTQGYVRRRITRELYPTMLYKGKQFYELSEIVGGGNSGGPLIMSQSRGKTKWEVFGIYIGENEKVGYGVRAEAFCDWVPMILGKTLWEESSS
jgi:Trypsin